MPSKGEIQDPLRRLLTYGELTLCASKFILRRKSNLNFHKRYLPANPTPITTPTSPALSSNISTPLKPSPQLPTFDNNSNKIFSNSLIASLSSRDAVLKEVRDCILTNNKSRLKAPNPYIHSFWRDLNVRSGCGCTDEKVAIPNVPKALIDDIHASHPGTWGMICMARHCW